MARKSKFTEPVRNRILEALRLGGTYDIAADYAGISRSTLYAWLDKGKNQQTGSYRTFLDDIKRAEAKGAIANLALIEKSAKAGDWKAAAWRLERRHGYTRDGIIRDHGKQTEKSLQDKPLLQVLQEQCVSTLDSMDKAKKSQSWQAYAALQRQYIYLLEQTQKEEQRLRAEGEIDGQENEDQLLMMVEQAIMSMSPIQRESILSLLGDGYDNVVGIQK